MKLKFPKKSKTATKKIISFDPWTIGTSLAAEIESKWESIIQCQTLHEFGKIIEVWCDQHRLAPYHVAANVMEIISGKQRN